MSKIVGVTVGTPISVRKIDEELKPVKTVNGKTPDENGNVDTGLTAADKQEIVDAVISGLPVYDGEVLDA